MKRSEVSIKTSSTPASLSFKGQATKHTTVKWSIQGKSGVSQLVVISSPLGIAEMSTVAAKFASV